MLDFLRREFHYAKTAWNEAERKIGESLKPLIIKGKTAIPTRN